MGEDAGALADRGQPDHAYRAIAERQLLVAAARCSRPASHMLEDVFVGQGFGFAAHGTMSPPLGSQSIGKDLRANSYFPFLPQRSRKGASRETSPSLLASAEGGSLQISRLRKVPGCIITEPVVELTQWIDIGTRDRPRSAPAESKLALVPIRPTCGSADTKSARCWARAEWARVIGLTILL